MQSILMSQVDPFLYLVSPFYRGLTRKIFDHVVESRCLTPDEWLIRLGQSENVNNNPTIDFPLRADMSLKIL